MFNEEDRELEELNEENNKPRKKNIAKRIIAFILASSITLGSAAAYFFRNNIKVRTSETSEIETLINNDNTAGTENEPRNITDETINNLNKIETYLNLSNTLDNLYEGYKDKITNINIGEATISENIIVELSDEEYQKLSNDLEIIANRHKEDDKYYQAIGRAVSYSSYVNAWLAYNAPKMIYDTLLTNCANDVASGLGLDFQRITIDYDTENKQLNILRNDNGTGESAYNIDAKGIRIDMIKDTLSKTYEIYTKTSEFLASGDQSIYTEGGRCLMTLGDNDGLIVYRNKELNNDIAEYVNTIKLMLCSTYKIKSAGFKYDLFIPEPIQNTEEQEITNRQYEISETSLSKNSKKLTLRR